MNVHDRATITLSDASHNTEILSLAADGPRGSIAFVQLPELYAVAWMRPRLSLT